MTRRVGDQTEWDYVIVGGGSAGCVLANRLSADPSTRVLLLEAGGWDRHLTLKIPAGTAKQPARFDWRYVGAPDPSRNGMVDTWAAGKVMGGGSSINMMLWVRGEPSDFDGWRDRGSPGWGYEDVLPYFERAESYTDGPAPRRGTSGPIGVRKARLPLEAVDDFLLAAEQTGHAPNPDYNGVRQQGVSVAQVSQRRGLRSSASRAYLAPVRRRRNLTIRTGAYATRIVVEGTRAAGVEYRHQGRLRVARAAREVILSAGWVVSPKLLMLSGIGPADHLREHGIEVRVDRPGVGTNLQEHAYGLLQYRTTADTLFEELKPRRALRHGLDFLLRGEGALTMTCSAVVFSPLTGERPTECEIILMPIGLDFAADRSAPGSTHNIHDVKPRPHGLMVYPSFVHPKGRGTVRLASTDPTATPTIEHSLVGDEDMQALIAACRLARQIFQAPAMKERSVVEDLPGGHVQSDEDWTEFLRVHSFRPYHGCGTCRMGSDDDAVVDPELRVRGVEGLRVVDASIFPTITSGNTNAPVIMVAEKAADLILRG
ncbi:MAG TPA: GMC family oxidoreductase N-terminal domain-containing protein [Acidimicrobiales bacterium]|nr:GMC family oxidoreductase N-terminal domain-containing protein [Acidimicrobiales bacterium]